MAAKGYDPTNEGHGEPPRPDARKTGVEPLTPKQEEAASKMTGPLSSAGGAAAGATAGGLTLGPIGAVIGAVAGALGGWWAGKAAADTEYTEEDELFFREHWTSSGSPGRADRFEATLPGYQLGHLAAHNPGYTTRTFDEIEPELARGWRTGLSARHGEWSAVRPYARAGYERRRTGEIPPTAVTAEMGGTPSHQRAVFSDPKPEAGDDARR